VRWASVKCNAAGPSPTCSPRTLPRGRRWRPKPRAKRAVNGEMWPWMARVRRVPVLGIGFGNIAGCEAPAGPLPGPTEGNWASTVTYWAICASAPSLRGDAQSRTTPNRHMRYTSRAKKREADVSLSAQLIPWRNPVAPMETPRCDGCFTPRGQTVKASCTWHKDAQPWRTR